MAGKKSGKSQGKKGSKKIGRKSRKMAFQRYKASNRFMDKLKRHVKKYPGDRVAARALDAREEAVSWVKWREVRKRRKMAA